MDKIAIIIYQMSSKDQWINHSKKTPILEVALRRRNVQVLQIFMSYFLNGKMFMQNLWKNYMNIEK